MLKHKIQHLIASGQSENIALGLQLAETLGISAKKILIPWRKLIRAFTKETVYSEKSLRTLFEVKQLVLYEGRLSEDALKNIQYLTQVESLHLHVPVARLDYYLSLASNFPLRKLTLELTEAAEPYALPASVFGFLRLERLRITGNIGQLPTAIAALQELDILVVSGGVLPTIPPAIFQLKKLTILGWMNNQLTVFPEEIHRLTYLKELWLDNNQIPAIHDLQTFPSQLQELNLQNNPLEYIPVQIWTMHYPLKVYLFDHQLPLWNCKALKEGAQEAALGQGVQFRFERQYSRMNYINTLFLY